MNRTMRQGLRLGRIGSVALWSAVLAGLGVGMTGQFPGGGRVRAQDEATAFTPVPQLVSWRGSVADEELLGENPPVVVTSAEEWSATWKAWQLPGDVPEVDFQRALVLIQTTRGGRINMLVRKDAKNDVSIAGFATRDLRPGFRYAIGVVLREGLATIGGKEIPAPLKPEKS